MEGYLKDKKSNWYSAPNNIVGVLVNPITGQIAKKDDKKSKMFYFIKGTEPYDDDGYDLDAVFKEENDSRALITQDEEESSNGNDN